MYVCTYSYATGVIRFVIILLSKQNIFKRIYKYICMCILVCSYNCNMRIFNLPNLLCNYDASAVPVLIYVNLCSDLAVLHRHVAVRESLKWEILMNTHTPLLSHKCDWYREKVKSGDDHAHNPL